MDATTALEVRHSIRISVPPERVFELLADRSELARWIPVTAFEPHVGGLFEMRSEDWLVQGEVTEF